MSANREEFAYCSDTLNLTKTKSETKQIFKAKHIYSKYVKRILDVVLSTTGLIICNYSDTYKNRQQRKCFF